MGYKIWQLMDGYTPGDDISGHPQGINYKTALVSRMHPERTFVKGELMRVDYFSIYNGLVFQDLILRVDMLWERADNVLTKRRETRQWVVADTDADFGPDVKVSYKYYDAEMAEKADARRRGNILAELTALSAKFGVKAQVQDLFLRYDDAINAYQKTGDHTIVDIIGAETETWLEYPVPGTPYTLRQMIVSELSI